jgi:hypothetical protein
MFARHGMTSRLLDSNSERYYLYICMERLWKAMKTFLLDSRGRELNTGPSGCEAGDITSNCLNRGQPVQRVNSCRKSPPPLLLNTHSLCIQQCWRPGDGVMWINEWSHDTHH